MCNILIDCVYRPPNAVMFNTEMFNILSVVEKKCKCPVFVMGDFNFDLWQAPPSKPIGEFLNNMLSHSYFLPYIIQRELLNPRRPYLIIYLQTKLVMKLMR